jgi:hypothetical protein
MSKVVHANTEDRELSNAGGEFKRGEMAGFQIIDIGDCKRSDAMLRRCHGSEIVFKPLSGLRGVVIANRPVEEKLIHTYIAKKISVTLAISTKILIILAIHHYSKFCFQARINFFRYLVK